MQFAGVRHVVCLSGVYFYLFSSLNPSWCPSGVYGLCLFRRLFHRRKWYIGFVMSYSRSLNAIGTDLVCEDLPFLCVCVCYVCGRCLGSAQDVLYPLCHFNYTQNLSCCFCWGTQSVYSLLAHSCEPGGGGLLRCS
jgi:hypothetical protein